jgi:mono/diheme cytochrome c family protein
MSQSSRSPSPVALAAIAAGALILGLLIFRSFGHAADLGEWTPGDHDQPAGREDRPPQVPQRPRATPSQEASDLAELAWGRSCATCHGEHGRGDGPQGPMVRAPDLTRADWQARVTDEEIVQIIRTGRNKMPSFDLPPAALEGLVKRIRANRAK